MPFESIEMTGPKLSVLLDPAVYGDKAVGPEGIDAPLSVWADLDEPDFAQDAQVSRHRRLGEIRQCRYEFTGGAIAGGQRVQENPAIWFGDCLKDIHWPSIALGLYRHKLIY
ncbi:hypothetical protein AB431_14070 [Mycobacterium sp. EPa45]|nr:hypothetical protein AB431_14070 [Mycobacterium sp. EPa45]